MSEFLTLPNESMLQIIGYLHPSTIVPFALTCRRLHDLSRDALQRHIAFQAHYSEIYLGVNPCCGSLWVPREGMQYHPVEFLGKILDDSEELPYYPVKLEIEPHHGRISCSCDHGDGGHGDDEIIANSKRALLRIIDTHSSELSKLVFESPFITAADRREHWLKALTDPECLSLTAFVAILMVLLPRLRRMTVMNCSVCSDNMYEIEEMVRAIAKANHDPTSQGHSRALTHLKAFALESRTGVGAFENLGLYEPFAALPSMCTLYGKMFDGAFESTYAPDLPAAASRVQELHMDSCIIESDSFDRLLQRIGALERFTYYHDGKMSMGTPYSASELVDLLKRYARYSLKALDLTCDRYKTDGNLRRYEPYVGSLKEFDQVRVVRLDEDAFKKHIEGPQARQPVAKDVDEDIESSEDELGAEVARVLDLLPASVRILKLVPKMSDMRAEEVFEDFVQEQRESLPLLKEIIWEGRCPLGEETRRQIKGLGVVLKSYEEVL